MKGILGKKLGMTQVFTETGTLIPVTVVEVSPNVVTQVKTIETDGYNAVQLGYQDKKDKHTNKPEAGHFKKANVTPKRFTKEFRLEDVSAYAAGQAVSANDVFEVGSYVDVTGTSKGKGFQGPIKRHGHSRGPETHGSRYHRRPGSLGAVAPVVFKGMKMAGHMGAETVTMQNLVIIDIDGDANIILIKGNVPGPKNSVIEIKQAVKKANKLEIKLANWEEVVEEVVEEAAIEANVDANTEETVEATEEA